MLEPSLRNDLIELIAANFRTDEINELGLLILGYFDSNEAAGTKGHISRTVYDALPQRMSSIFQFGGIFEGRDFFRTSKRLDSFLCEDSSDGEEQLA